VGLDIDVVCTEELFRPLNRQILCNIHKLAAAVITSTRIALCIFIGKLTTHGFQYSTAHEVLRCNQLELLVLPISLVLNNLQNLWIGFFQELKQTNHLSFWNMLMKE
jgi:hypothetical protein